MGRLVGHGHAQTYPQRNVVPHHSVATVYTADSGWALGRRVSDALYGVRRRVDPNEGEPDSCSAIILHSNRRPGNLTRSPRRSGRGFMTQTRAVKSTRTTVNRVKPNFIILELVALSAFRCGKHAEHCESNRGTSSRA